MSEMISTRRYDSNICYPAVTLAEALGALIWWVNLALQTKPDVAGRCAVLGVSEGFGDGVSHQHGVIGFSPYRSAVCGEILVIDDHLVRDETTRESLFIFLRAAFEELVVGSRKVFVVRNSPEECIVFLPSLNFGIKECLEEASLIDTSRLIRRLDWNALVGDFLKIKKKKIVPVIDRESEK